MPAMGVLKAAATPAAPPARRTPGRAFRVEPAECRHDRGPHLDRRSLAPRRGAADEAQRHDQDLAERRLEGDQGVADRRVLRMARGDHLGNPRALRVREHPNGEQDRDGEAERRQHQGDEGGGRDDPAEYFVRPIGELGHPNGSEPDTEASEQEQQALPPQGRRIGGRPTPAVQSPARRRGGGSGLKHDRRPAWAIDRRMGDTFVNRPRLSGAAERSPESRTRGRSSFCSTGGSGFRARLWRPGKTGKDHERVRRLSGTNRRPEDSRQASTLTKPGHSPGEARDARRVPPLSSSCAVSFPPSPQLGRVRRRS